MLNTKQAQPAYRGAATDFRDLVAPLIADEQGLLFTSDAVKELEKLGYSHNSAHNTVYGWTDPSGRFGYRRPRQFSPRQRASDPPEGAVGKATHPDKNTIEKMREQLTAKADALGLSSYEYRRQTAERNTQIVYKAIRDNTKPNGTFSSPDVMHQAMANGCSGGPVVYEKLHKIAPGRRGQVRRVLPEYYNTVYDVRKPTAVKTPRAPAPPVEVAPKTPAEQQAKNSPRMAQRVILAAVDEVVRRQANGLGYFSNIKVVDELAHRYHVSRATAQRHINLISVWLPGSRKIRQLIGPDGVPLPNAKVTPAIDPAVEPPKVFVQEPSFSDPPIHAHVDPDPRVVDAALGAYRPEPPPVPLAPKVKVIPDNTATIAGLTGMATGITALVLEIIRWVA